MAKFLIYLFESGLCLSLFYLGYVIFFRKETYFTFNRIYLMASMVLALTLPLLPIQIKVTEADYLNSTIQRLGQFRSYYEELILITDPEYVVSNEERIKQVSGNLDSTKLHLSTSNVQNAYTSFNFSKLLYYIYFSGLLFFALRLLLLLYSLNRLIARNKTISHDGYTIVLLREEMPSFSFLKWVFVNKEALKPEEFQQVITHEKVHVDHKHSVDLILAQVIAILQWFNPLTWRIQKSLKTCHEYIADRQVIDQGHELFDYQSLLLSQLISIRSVELVNNFNLLSIKKRIAMMNKIKSGRSAKLKALFSIPMLVVAFFFFAEVVGKSVKLTNQEAFVENIHANVSKVVADPLETNLERPIAINDVAHELITRKATTENLEYKKGLTDIDLGNGITDITPNSDKALVSKVDLPVVKSVKGFDIEHILFTIRLAPDGFYMNGEKKNLNNIETLIANNNRTNSVSNKPVLLQIDKGISMSEVDKVKLALRNSSLLKIAYAATPKGVVDFRENESALFNLLPPKDAKALSREEAFFEGIKIFVIKHSSHSKRRNMQNELHSHIMKNDKYVILYEYNNSTTYDDYLSVLDEVYSTVWDIRKDNAETLGIDYHSMTKAQEKVLRKKFPLTLMMKNVDSE